VFAHLGADVNKTTGTIIGNVIAYAAHPNPRLAKNTFGIKDGLGHTFLNELARSMFKEFEAAKCFHVCLLHIYMQSKGKSGGLI
jgi:hypothetical protein